MCAFEKPKGNPAAFIRPATTVLRRAVLLCRSTLAAIGGASRAGAARGEGACNQLPYLAPLPAARI